MNLNDRITRLEYARRQQPRLVLIAGHGVLTAEQRDQAHQAQAEGREVFIINVMGRPKLRPSS